MRKLEELINKEELLSELVGMIGPHLKRVSLKKTELLSLTQTYEYYESIGALIAINQICDFILGDPKL